MKALILAGVAAVLATSAASAQSYPSPLSGVAPTVSITGIGAVSGGSTAVNVNQNSNFNAAFVGVVSPNAAVRVTQSGTGFNGAAVGTFGNNSNVAIGQFGARFGNMANVIQRSR